MNNWQPENLDSRTVWDRFGIPERGEKLYNALYVGFTYTIVIRISEIINLNDTEVAKFLRISKTTLSRRKKANRLNVEESDRCFRLIELIATVSQYFEEDEIRLAMWLKTPVFSLANKRPIDMVGTSAKLKEVHRLIHRLEHGLEP